MTQTEISIAIIAKDASATISRCLVSAKVISDDLVVVIDSRTGDDTAQICRKLGARVYTRRFDNFAAQKNYALTFVRHSWILSLDSDEWLGSDLQSQILALFPSGDTTAFRLPRKNYIFGRLINHTNWDPDGLVRLFQKNKAVWEGDVHEQIVTRGQIGELSAPILHENYRTVTEFLTRQDYYSTLEAAQKYNSGVRFDPVSALARPVYEFLRRYIWHAGFLDGWHGLFLSYLMSVYHFSVWVKLWQKSRVV